MAEYTLSILVKAVGAAKASKDLTGVDAAVSRIGAHAGQGLRTAASNIAKLGAVVAVGLGAAVKTGLDDLATLENATSSVDGAIRQVGLTGKLTGSQVATWANEIEASIGAAFDDKEIVAASAQLLRFGKVAPRNLRPAMVVMTDLATKTGSVDSAAALLAKALADPAKAAGKLARSGVVLTKQQQAQIAALMKAGKAAQAQALLLSLLAKTTKGAAAASQGPYKRALSILADVSEDARKALAEGFLPVIERVATMLSTQLAKPATMANIREFGQGLARGLDSLISVAERLPWGSIADAMKLAGAGAKAALEVFTAMPPWVQTAILTGWGLNKLSGGALTGIVGELGKGLIKGVLGMNAGVVNINAGVVNGGGGLPGPAAGGGGGVLGTAARMVIPVAIASITVAAAKVLGDMIDPNASRPGTPAFVRAQNQRNPYTHGAAPPPGMIVGPDGRLIPAGGRTRPLEGPERQRTRPLEGSAGFNAKFLAPDVRAERVALERFTGSTAPSMRSMEAHLARLREIQQRTPAEDRTNTNAIVSAIRGLQATIIANRPIVNVTARSVEKATVGWRRTASVSRVGID